MFKVACAQGLFFGRLLIICGFGISKNQEIEHFFFDFLIFE